MPPNAPDASDAAEFRPAASGTPRARLAQLREEQLRERDETSELIMTAALIVSGEAGYRKASVQNVLDHYGGHRAQFYRQFTSFDEAYAAAYAAHSGRLCDELLAAGARAPSWRAGLREALEELGRFAGAQPALARGLLLEVHVAGRPALGAREEAFERLAAAVDSARGEPGSDRSAPALTAQFMVNAIDAALMAALVRGEPQRFVQAIPELEKIVSTAYFGRGVRG